MDNARSDITKVLVHLTREANDLSSFEILLQILTDGKLKGSNNNGFIKGSQSATCFTEAPLSALKHFATDESESHNARYRFYGIAISKETAFKQGARPVIYLPDNEAEWIPDTERWRHVRFEQGKVDWTHEREWRSRGDFDLSKVKGIYIICFDPSEVSKLENIANNKLKGKIRGFLPMKHLNQML